MRSSGHAGPIAPETRATIGAFFGAVFQNCPGVIELRALPSASRRFGPIDGPDGHLNFLLEHGDEDLYFGVATRRDATSGTLDNCAALAALFVDIDFKDVPEAEACAPLAAFQHPPSIVVASGGGLHCYWYLMSPLRFPGDAPAARDLLRRLARALGGDMSAAEPARLLRVPCTLNYKYQPARRVNVHGADVERRYDLNELAEALPAEPEASRAGGPFRVPNAIPKGERRTTIFRLARSLRTRELSRDAVLAAARVENLTRCRPPLPPAQVEEQVDNAFRRRDNADFSANGHGPESAGADAADAEEVEVGVEVEDVAPQDAAEAPVTLTLPEPAWRGPFADYREAVAGTSEASDAAHFAAFWGIAATILRRRAWIYYAFPHYPNVYLVVFGRTGDSKTSATRQALALVEGIPDIKVLRSLGSAEALCDWMQGDPEAVKDTPSPYRHLLFLEELAGALTRGGWEGSSLLTFLTEVFDTPPLYEIPFRKKPVKVVEPTPTLLAGTTPDWFWRAMRELDFHGGFGNRLFFLTGAPKEPIPMPGRPHPEPLGRVRLALDRLSDLPPRELALTSDALATWTDFYTAWKGTVADFDALTYAATKRVPAYALKLALTYAALEGAGAIGVGQLEAALQVADYGVKCARQLIAAQQHASVQGRVEQAVVRALKSGARPAWKIRQAIGGRFSADELMRALRPLVAAGVVIVTQTTSRERPVYGLPGRRRGP